VKKLIILLSALLLVLTPCLVMAATASSNEQLNEITALNSLEATNTLLTHTGGRCWQSCADDDYGKLNCVTTCNEDGATGPYQGGGGGGELTPERLIFISLAAVALGILCWYIIQSSINAGNSVGA